LNEKKEHAISSWLPPSGSDYVYTFSGRSAIELAIMNIMRKRNVKRVYMPSYCCNSMLQPFLNQHNLEILFYQVDVKDGKLCYDIEFDNDVDLFFALNYFGIDESIDPFIERFKQMGAVIIEDITHRLLSNHSHNKH